MLGKGENETLFSPGFSVAIESNGLFGECGAVPKTKYLEGAPFLGSICKWLFPYRQGTTLELVLSGSYAEREILGAYEAIEKVIWEPKR